MTTGNAAPAGEQGPGYFFVNKFGRNPDVDTGTTPEDAWSGGGLYPWIDPASPVELEVVSTDVNDTGAGAGAQTVDFELLDSAGNKVIKTITMDGTTAVPVPGGPFTAHNTGQVLTSGASEKNEGTISIRDSGGGTVRGIIDFNAALGGGAGRTLQAIYTMESGNNPKKGKIKRHWARLDRFPGGNAQGRIVVRSAGGSWNTRETFAFSDSARHDVTYPGRTGIEIAAGAQIRMEIFDVSANDIVIDAGFDIEGEDE